MIIIGEKINGAIPATAKAIAARDAEYIKRLARIQTTAGVDYIDVCASVENNVELVTMKWLIDIVQEVTDTPIAVDSPNEQTCIAAMNYCNKPGLFNSVSMMIESAGFTMVDLGVDVPAEKFVEAARENDNVTLIACSGLLTTTMPALKEAVATITASDLSNCKVIVGGAPVTLEFAAEIGADGYAADAGSAAVKAKELVK